MNLIEAVNEVLVRLRQKEESSTSSTTGKLMKLFVNQALRWAEAKAEWQVHRHTVTLTTVSGTAEYELEDSNQYSRPVYEFSEQFGSHRPLVFNTSVDKSRYGWMSQKDKHYWWTNRKSGLGAIQKEAPFQFVFLGRSTTSNLMRIGLLPEPNDEYTIDFELNTPQGTIEVDTTEIQVPPQSVVLYAHALAIAERGEDGGTTFNETMKLAQDQLSRDIADDSTWTDFEMVMRAE